MNFILRKWTLNDADSFVRHVNDKEITDNLSDLYPYPYSMENAVSSINVFTGADETQLLTRAIDVSNEAVGSIGIILNTGIYCKTADIGYWLGKMYWSNGIMTQAVKQMCEIAFARYDIVRISASVFSGNKASIRVLEKAGFEYEGLMKKNIFKNGAILDSCLYALTK